MADEKDRTHLDEKAHDSDHEPDRYGDVLGVSDAPVDVEIPRATEDRGGHPAGIEVRKRSTGTGHLQQSDGAVGVDIGAGAPGNPVASDKDVND
jgi:hypothetical protein